MATQTPVTLTAGNAATKLTAQTKTSVVPQGSGGGGNTVKLAFDPPTVASGGSTILRLTSTEPAPKGGVVIKLSSDDPLLVPVPVSFTVPEGANHYEIPIKVGTSAAGKQVTITMTEGNESLKAILTVTPKK